MIFNMNFSLIVIILLVVAIDLVYPIKHTYNHIITSLHHQNNHMNMKINKIIKIKGGKTDNNDNNNNNNNKTNNKTNNKSKYSKETLKFIADITKASTLEELFEVCENIPIILNCQDKALKITEASINDSLLTSYALQRFAIISSDLNNEIKSSTSSNSHDNNNDDIKNENSDKHICLSDILRRDRRFQQLLEILECSLHTLPVLDICRIIWSLTVVGINDDNGYNTINLCIKQFLNRINIAYYHAHDRHGQTMPTYNSLNGQELATMVWTLGCIKHTFGSSSSSSSSSGSSNGSDSGSGSDRSSGSSISSNWQYW